MHDSSCQFNSAATHHNIIDRHFAIGLVHTDSEAHYLRHRPRPRSDKTQQKDQNRIIIRERSRRYSVFSHPTSRAVRLTAQFLLCCRWWNRIGNCDLRHTNRKANQKESKRRELLSPERCSGQWCFSISQAASGDCQFTSRWHCRSFSYRRE